MRKKELNAYKGYNQYEVDISNFTKGLYVIRLFNQEFDTAKKLIKY